MLAAAAALTFAVCTKAFATYGNIVKQTSYAYWVQITNTEPYRIYCVLTATNGAYYDGYIQAYSKSGYMRINDPSATYYWNCNRA